MAITKTIECEVFADANPLNVAGFKFPGLSGGAKEVNLMPGDGGMFNSGELTAGRSYGEEPVTSAGHRVSILSAATEIVSNRLVPPAALDDLLHRAVEARRLRVNEDIEAWSERLATEAARIDG